MGLRVAAKERLAVLNQKEIDSIAAVNSEDLVQGMHWVLEEIAKAEVVEEEFLQYRFAAPYIAPAVAGPAGTAPGADRMVPAALVPVVLLQCFRNYPAGCCSLDDQLLAVVYGVANSKLEILVAGSNCSDLTDSLLDWHSTTVGRATVEEVCTHLALETLAGAAAVPIVAVAIVVGGYITGMAADDRSAAPGSVDHGDFGSFDSYAGEKEDLQKAYSLASSLLSCLVCLASAFLL